MTGLEQMVVWLFGSLCAAVSVCSVAKSWAQGLIEVAREHARAHVEGMRIAAEAQQGPVFVPQEWNPREGL